MKNEKEPGEDAAKTAALFAPIALLAAIPDSALCKVTALLAAVGLVAVAHEEGKKSRPIENSVNKANSFFSPLTGNQSTELKTALGNIVVGGGKLCDQLVEAIKPK